MSERVLGWVAIGLLIIFGVGVVWKQIGIENSLTQIRGQTEQIERKLDIVHGQSHVKVMGGSIRLRYLKGWQPYKSGYMTDKFTASKISLDDAEECIPVPPNSATSWPVKDKQWLITVWGRLPTDGSGTQNHGPNGINICSNADNNGCVQPASSGSPGGSVYAFPIKDSLFNKDVPHIGSQVTDLGYHDTSKGGDGKPLCDPNINAPPYCDYEKQIDITVGTSSLVSFMAPDGLCRVIISQ
jgi:hypothetical protein